MLTTQTIMEHLTGREIFDTLILTMAERFDDFAEAKEQYEQAMGLLRGELGADSVDAEAEAIRRQISSDLLFSGVLGLKANLDNFINPMARNFLDVDAETYLRENTAHRLPEYENALEARQRFFAKLSPAQREIYEPITTYVSHLETAGPKLAHYCGYLLGNDLLHRVIPGYHSDGALTIRYRMMMKDYFGRDFF